MASPASLVDPSTRHSKLAPRRPGTQAVLIFNPHAGKKLGLATNLGGPQGTQAALKAAGVSFEPWPTEAAGHAMELAQRAVAEGRELVIAAGGDGTVAEVAHGLASTSVTLGIMPLGSVMNVARTLCIPRDLEQAAKVIAEGNVLAMDMGRVGDRYFLEAAGIGLDAGLFAYFNRLDQGRASLSVTTRGMLKFIASLGTPHVVIEADGDRRYEVRAPMVAVANSRYVGAAHVVAPDARIDDGQLDVVIFRGASVPRLLLHLLRVAGGRRVPLPPNAHTLRARSVTVASRRRRQLPVHADGAVVGTTPARFDVAPAALRVLVGAPDSATDCAWGNSTASPSRRPAAAL